VFARYYIVSDRRVQETALKLDTFIKAKDAAKQAAQKQKEP